MQLVNPTTHLLYDRHIFLTLPPPTHQATLMELRALLDGRAAASVIEGRWERGLGPVATVLVRGGALQVRAAGWLAGWLVGWLAGWLVGARRCRGAVVGS